MLSGKKILLGVTGSIAAYKSAEIVRLLVKSGADVTVIMTEKACEFITPLTLSVLSKNPVSVHLTGDDGSTWNNHVHLAASADLFLIAPATAQSLAKFAGGYSDNLLTAVFLSCSCPVFIAPAMDLEMYRHPAVRANIDILVKNGTHLLKPGSGELASGLVGEGRMQEPAEIIHNLELFLSNNAPLKNKRFLVTAGPTFEAIDPVRFIGNHSSGKMGFAVAETLASKGAEVILVTGPVNLTAKEPGIIRYDVTSAAEMAKVCLREFGACDGAIMAAAVADYSPDKTATKKIKKSGEGLDLHLVPTMDILSRLGEMKKSNQVLVGFALETNDGEKNALDKLKRKNLDFIVLNSLSDPGAGFSVDTNKVVVFDKRNNKKEFGLMHKSLIAEEIVKHIFAV